MFYPFEMEKYLESLLPERGKLFLELEEQALRETIPIVTPAVGNFLALMIIQGKHRRILELGTAIGYSTLWLAKAIEGLGGHITTIEMNQGRREQALVHFARAGLSDLITSLTGDARKILPTLGKTFDFIFIDAAKGEYLEYLELVRPLLEPGGVLIVDNVLFRGWVVPGTKFEPKYNRMVAGLRGFLTALNEDPELITSVLPFGDGISISIRRQNAQTS